MSFSILGNLDAFLIGMSLEASKETKNAQSLKQAVQKTTQALDKDFRDVYDSVMPNIHILDADYTIKILLRDLISKPENYFSKYKEPVPGTDMVYEEDLDKNKAKEILPGFLTESVKSRIRRNVLQAIKEFHSGLPTKEKNPLVELNSIMSPISLQVENLLLDETILPDAKIAAISRLGSQFKKQIDQIFGKAALLALNIPEFGSSETRFVFFGKQFSGMSQRINKTIGDAFKKELEATSKIQENFVAKQSLEVGKTIHFAHTGVKSNAAVFLNSPGYAKLIFNTLNNPSGNSRSPFTDAYRASNYFKLKTGHTKLALNVSSEVSQNISTLMSLGLTITTDHTAELNLLTGKKESKISSGIYGSAQKATQALRSFIQKRGAAEIIQKLVSDSPHLGRSSPNIVEKIESYFVDVIKTGKARKNRTSTNKTKNVVDFSYLSPAKLKPVKINTKTTVKSKSRPAVKTDVPTVKPVQSRIDLVTLINIKLHDQIKSNMGTGNRRDVLNYRTGRFGKSVKVERISQSRQGMITAFYSYMRNPYATFSAGGNQQFPRSRDPKLLIAKSIREIAQSIVSNQIRSVNV